MATMSRAFLLLLVLCILATDAAERCDTRLGLSFRSDGPRHMSVPRVATPMRALQVLRGGEPGSDTELQAGANDSDDDNVRKDHQVTSPGRCESQQLGNAMPTLVQKKVAVCEQLGIDSSMPMPEIIKKAAADIGVLEHKLEGKNIAEKFDLLCEELGIVLGCHETLEDESEVGVENVGTTLEETIAHQPPTVSGCELAHDEEAESVQTAIDAQEQTGPLEEAIPQQLEPGYELKEEAESVQAAIDDQEQTEPLEKAIPQQLVPGCELKKKADNLQTAIDAKEHTDPQSFTASVPLTRPTRSYSRQLIPGCKNAEEVLESAGLRGGSQAIDAQKHTRALEEAIPQQLVPGCKLQDHSDPQSSTASIPATRPKRSRSRQLIPGCKSVEEVLESLSLRGNSEPIAP